MHQDWVLCRIILPLCSMKLNFPPSLSPRIFQGTFQGGQDVRRALGEFALLSCLLCHHWWSSHASDEWLLGLMLPNLTVSLQGTQALNWVCQTWLEWQLFLIGHFIMDASHGFSQSHFLCSKIGMMILAQECCEDHIRHNNCYETLAWYSSRYHLLGRDTSSGRLLVSCPLGPGQPSQGDTMFCLPDEKTEAQEGNTKVHLSFLPHAACHKAETHSCHFSREVNVTAMSLLSPHRSCCGFLNNAVTTWY